MAAQQTRTAVKPQLIPTNAGYRTFASPPAALQKQIVPNDLFYIRNHWRDLPEIDAATYRLVVDGEVDRPLSLSHEELREMAAETVRGHSGMLWQRPGPRVLAEGQPHGLGDGADQRAWHHE